MSLLANTMPQTWPRLEENVLNTKLTNSKHIKNDTRNQGFVVKYLPANNPYKMGY